MSFVVRGEGSFAEAVRRALEYAQSRGVDLSGVEVEVVPDPSIRDAGAYTEHIGGLRFRIRYNPRYAGDPVLASHEAGHVAYWTWQIKKRGGVQYVPDVDEPLAEAFGAVVARQLYSWPVTFKGAPLNLTQILPQRAAYITATVDGKQVAVKVPEWGDYMSRYRAGIFLSPYFYNMTNWSHVFGNVTAMPGDVLDTVHKAWREGAVETVPGWGAVWRTTPTWSWPSGSTDDSRLQNSAEPAKTNTLNTQNANDAKKTAPTNTAITTTGSTPPGKEHNTPAVVTAQPSADVPLPPSNIQPPRYFSTDITPKYNEVPEWSSYISGRRVLVVFRNWPFLDTTTLKEIRKDYVAGVGVVLGDRVRFEKRVPVPRVVDPNAWIEFVDEKTGKVLARLRSDELYKLTNEGAPVTLFWAHVAAEEKWPGWERSAERAKELDEKLGTWKSGAASSVQPGGRGAANINPDGTASAVSVSNAPTEYVPPKVPDDVRKQFENLLSELKKLGEGVNLRNVGEVHDKFIQLRDKVLDTARAYPQLIDEANRAVGIVGSAIRNASDKIYEALAKAAGRDSFWKGEGDVKAPIGVYKYDPATGAFLLSLYDGPTAENIVGFIKDDGTPVVVKKTQSMSEALEEYSKIKSKPSSVFVQTGGGVRPPPVPAVQTDTPSGGQQNDFLSGAASFLANALKTGAGIVLTALGGSKTPSIKEDSSSEFVRQQKREDAVKPSRPPDYILAEEEARKRRSSGPPGFSNLFSSLAGTPALGSLLRSQGGSSADSSSFAGQQSRDYTKGRGLWGASGPPSVATSTSPPSTQLEESSPQSQESSSKRYKGRPVAVAV